MKVTPKILSHGYELNSDESAFGELHRSDPALSSIELRERFAQDGYLYLPGLLSREDVKEARREMTALLAQKNLLDPAYPAIEAVKREGATMEFLADPWTAMEYMNSIAKKNPAVQRVLYSGTILEFFETLFGEPVRHFDFTWVRTMGPGFGTDAHCDIVYMGRGSSRLCTLWVPYGDLTYEIGGLMVLEGSHRQAAKLDNYLSRDVDRYCKNRPEAEKIESGEIPWTWNGVLSNNPVTLRERLGGRWLSAEYRMGDVLIFGMKTVHASLDNQTHFFRISTDSRYQPAGDPIDPRWVGENPIGHGREAKTGMIC